MKIFLIERIVERCNDPANPNYLKVKDMSTKVVDEYSSNVIPRKGEVIFIDEDKIYDVVEVIYQRHGLSRPGEAGFSVHIEVKPHVSRHTHQTVSYSFEEEWPLIVSLPADLSWYTQNLPEKDDEFDEIEDYADDDPYYV